MNEREKILHHPGDNDNYYERAEKILNDLQSKKENGDFNGLTAYEEAVNLGFKGTKEEWIESLKGDKPEKGVDYYTEQDKQEILDTLIETETFKGKVNKSELNNYEKTHTYYSMTIKEPISDNIEVEIPCSYIVGSDSLVIYHNGDRLICEKSEEDIANYKEVGQVGEISNKIIFGWDLRVGDVLDFTVKGVVANEENEN